MSTAIHRNHPLLTKIVISIFIVATLVSMIIAGVQLYYTYLIEKKHISEMLDSLEKTQINTLVNNLWNMDQNALQIQLHGIFEHPDIVYIQLIDETRSKIELGTPPEKSSESVSRKFLLARNIQQQSKRLGEIEFFATTKNIKSKLLANTSKILGTQLITIFTTCLTILFLFVHLFNRHINRIIEYTETVKVEQLDRRLTLLRKKNTYSKPDELDRIVNSINTMQKRLEEEIEAQQQIKKNLFEEKLFSDTIINSLPGILFVLDSNYQPVRFNRLFKLKLRIKDEDIPHFSVISLVVPGETTRVKRIVKQVIESGVPTSLEINILNANQKMVPFLFTISVLELEAEKLLIGIGTDISDQKKIEEQLRQAQKMEAIGNLAGGIAHDFNNILAALIGYNQLALLGTKDNPKIQKYLKETEKASERAKNLVAQILAFSRKQETEKAPVQVDLILNETLKLLRSSIPSSIEIHKNIAATKKFVGDSTEIHQIIMNLCTNAFQAMEKTGGILSVSLADRVISAGDLFPDVKIPPGHYLNLEVCDTGPGMDETISTKIFEPYFTTKKAGVGTGLGLAVVHGIVTQNNGYISLYSNATKGTTFNVFLPVTHDKTTPEPEKNIFTQDIKGDDEKIMVIDDDASILNYYEELLCNFGYKVTTFNNSTKALEQFKKTGDTFDLIITDYTMPSISGKELGKEILNIRADIPIIICSGYSGELGKNTFVKLGFAEYLQKPIDTNHLLTRIHELLNPA